MKEFGICLWYMFYLDLRNLLVNSFELIVIKSYVLLGLGLQSSQFPRVTWCNGRPIHRGKDQVQFLSVF